MSSKYQFDDREGVYFVYSSVVDWIDVFTRDIYLGILLDSFRFRQKNQNLQLHAKQPIDWKHSSAIDYYTEERERFIGISKIRLRIAWLLF